MLRVQEICKKKGITMRNLAKKMGITYRALHAIVTGNPTIGKLNELAEALQVQITDLFAEPPEGVLTCPHCGEKITIIVGKIAE